MTTEEEIASLRQKIRSNESIIRMMEGNTDPDWLKKLEKKWNDELRTRIAELRKNV